MRLTRRQFLVGGGVVGVPLVAGCSELLRGPSDPPRETERPTGTPTPADGTPTPEEPTPTETATETETPTPPPYDEVSVTDFGAKMDGVTDDTAALRQALAAVAPGGTVIVPAGTLVVRADPETKAAVALQRPLRGITLRGADGIGLPSRIRMAGGHDHNHNTILIGEADGDEVGDGITIQDLAFDGNWSAQTGRKGWFPNGFGVQIRGDGRRTTVENCLFENWATNGALMVAAGMVVRDCTFNHNGYGAASVGRDGHGANAGSSGAPVRFERCRFTDNTGAGIDNVFGRYIATDCAFDGNQYGVKVDDPSVETVLRNCSFDMQGQGNQCIYTVPGKRNVGTVRLENVHIANATWAGIDIPSKGRVVGDNILLTNCNQGKHRRGAIYVRGGVTFDIGTLSVHGTDGDVLQFDEAQGKIHRLVYSGNTGNIGKLSEVVVDQRVLSTPITLDVPDPSSVGAMNLHPRGSLVHGSR